MDTTEESLAEFLVARGYDVWLFDYRGSPALDASRQPFTIDDLAREDWPAAVEMVQSISGAKDVQIIAHCFGSTSLLMGLLAGLKGVRSVISSQTSLHPVTSWFNYAKADTHLATMLAHGVPKSIDGLLDSMGLPAELTDMLEKGMKTIDMISECDPKAKDYKMDKVLDAMLWGVPFPGETPCYNPVCHRVFGIFGASYAHDQLNEATHNALGRVFGEISTEPFLQLAQIVRYGRAVDARGGNTYMDKPENINIPVDFLAGGQNRIFLPETTLRTLRWLEATHKTAPKGMFTRQVFEDYAHMDMFIGKRAHQEVFPYLLERLQARDGGQNS
jgi:pimeloyl-ACP methyl ester carboxylesterase